MKAVFLLLISLIPVFALHAATPVYEYEPKKITLTGTLTLQEFAGPPNYESVARGDELERYWILKLPKPIKVVAKANDELFYTQGNVKEIQLVCFEGCREQFAFSLDKKVRLTGTLFSAHTGHHHKGVLMTVQKAD